MNLTVANRLRIRPRDLQRSDLLNFIREHKIRRITFNYTGGDGRLKELILPINNMVYAERILAAGERVDGSSLFKGMVGPDSSDLYVVPEYNTAFLNPFDDESVNILCRFLDKNEELSEFCPDNILRKNAEDFRSRYGLDIWALGELEFYLIGDVDGERYPLANQEGYHASAPFVKYDTVVKEMIEHIAGITGHVKYGHSEVGNISPMLSENPKLNGRYAQQVEIEFLPAPIEKAADFLILAKWVVRNVAARHGLQVSFAPKLETGIAGSGLHFHLELLKDEVNQMTTSSGELSPLARQAIAGILAKGPALAAFGNTIPSSYLRLVPGQESPTRLFWSDLNRAALVRVPLGWRKGEDMASIINHRLKDRYISPFKRQTVEVRSADGSAHIHLFLSVIVAAIGHGLADPEQAEALAVERYVSKDQQEKAQGIPALPPSCAAAAEALRTEGKWLTGFLPERIVDWLESSLLSYGDEHFQDELADLEGDERLAEERACMHHFIDIG